MFEIVGSVELIGEEVAFTAASAWIHSMADAAIFAGTAELGPLGPFVAFALRGPIHRRINRELAATHFARRLKRRREARAARFGARARAHRIGHAAVHHVVTRKVHTRRAGRKSG